MISLLTQDRHSTILNLLKEKSSVTLNELMSILNTSESTIRRDLTALDKSGKLRKVYGGATSIDYYTADEKDMHTKHDMQIDEKNAIAIKAATLIQNNDLVYIDAGTTTELIINHLSQFNATYVTNGIIHANKLIERGFKTFIIAGQLKKTTGCVIGPNAIESLLPYNFTKGFFGTNGISIKSGFSTPDSTEACVKKTALNQCQKAYVLADRTKFDKITPITFAKLKDAIIITDKLPSKKYLDYTQIMEVL